jgi:linoleoyl-CoA desaturase
MTFQPAMDGFYLKHFMEKIKFVNKEQLSLFATLRARVDEYFEINQLPKHGGRKVIIKSILMILLYLVPYVMILLGYFSNGINLLLAVIMGLGVAGTGMNVMHEAIHGSFSEKNWINKLFGASIYLLGGNAYNWEVQHNQLHHTYTNIHEVDEDITGKFLLRLNVAEKRKGIHRFQHIYAFFLYSLMTISFLWKDFKEIGLFNELSKTNIVKAFSRRELYVLLLSKLGYVLFIFVLPMAITNISVGQWAIGFLAMHAVAGLILSTIFQLAHVVEGAHQPIPDTNYCVKSAWAVHQLNTTSNFSGKNRLLSWYIGGLDYQIEHHLFPKISHIYYRDLSKIVASTAQEFGFNYNSKGSFGYALSSHIKMLKQLGAAPQL